jgi:subtilase family serine protease
VGTASENKTHLTHNEVLDSNNLQVTLTAPTKAQTLKVTIIANAVDNDGTDSGDHWNYVTKEITILKLREIYINASVRNSGDMDSSPVNVTLFVDDQFVDQQSIASIKAGGEQNVTFTWDATKYKAGDYKVEVVLDTNQTILELNEGNNRLVKTVTLDDISGQTNQPYDYTQVAYWSLGIIIVALVVGLFWKFYG